MFCLGHFCRARRPVPFWWRLALFKKLKWRCLFYQFKKKCQSHMAFSSVLSFLLSTQYCCAVPLLLSVHRINGALFLPFTALIVAFWPSVHRTKSALFRWHPALLKSWAEHWNAYDSSPIQKLKCRKIWMLNNGGFAQNTFPEVFGLVRHAFWND